MQLRSFTNTLTLGGLQFSVISQTSCVSAVEQVGRAVGASEEDI